MSDIPDRVKGQILSAIATEIGIGKSLLALAAAAATMDDLDEQLDWLVKPCGKPGCDCHIAGQVIVEPFKKFMNHYLNSIKPEQESEIDKTFKNLFVNENDK